MDPVTSALADIRLESDGMLAFHNMPCACCLRKHAVYDCQVGIFQPCWECQRSGWKIAKATSKVGLLRRLFGANP